MNTVYKLKMDDKQFSNLSSIVHDSCGIKLPQGKQTMVVRRLTPRLSSLGISDLGEYIDLVEKKGSDEINTLINLVTTNFTYFFREPHHFEYMQKELLADIMQKNVASKKIRIWCAATSTGEEPYSIGMSLLDAEPKLAKWDVKILATDVDTKVLDVAKTGIYEEKKLESLDNLTAKKWFVRGKGANQGKFKVKPELRDMIIFQQLNLLGDSWPMKGSFDIIFCRNVFIYFDKETQSKIMYRFCEYQKKGAALFIGHSENVTYLTGAYKLVGKSIYRKPE